MYDRTHELEWLETNGIGGYASSTVLGCHTRKYHGLLVSRLATPGGKFVLLSKLEDSVFFGGEERFMTAHRYRGVTVPAGEMPLGFELKNRPVFRYRFGPVTVQKEIMLIQGEDTVLVKYTCTKNRVDARLRIKPLIAYRDFHALTGENLFLRVRTFPIDRGFVMSPYDGMPSLNMQVTGTFQFYPAPTWYRGFEYKEEQQRGFDAWEDLFCPGVFELDFEKNQSVIVSASTEAKGNLGELWDREMADRERRSRSVRGTDLSKALKRSARQFVSSGPSGQRTVIAGFPWFLEWGRDAMIALPGLLLTGEKTPLYLDVLESFAETAKRGIIPNFLGDTPEENAYNSADAALWFGWAVQQYLEAHPRGAKDIPGVVKTALEQTFSHYQNGTDHGIRMLANGLLTVGSPDEQVTWMDANVDGRPVTPRWGCPVEINALWYNFVSFLASAGKSLGLASVASAPAIAARIRESFNRAFWLEGEGYLADVVRGDEVDASLRPNQIFAVSLGFSPLDLQRSRSVVGKVRSELKTPFGLRTLARSDPRYRGRYEGGPAERDAAYHNGTVWPWLLGHYGEALLKVSDNQQAAIEELEECLTAFEGHLGEAGIGTVSEIFDAESPYSPRGCISQAWSVAEVLRLNALVEKAKLALSKERSQCAS
jgi:predicted glycogen debranching enzyme